MWSRSTHPNLSKRCSPPTIDHMPSDLTHLGVRIAPVSDGIRIDLPRRDLGLWKLIGLLILLMFSGFALTPVVWIFSTMNLGEPASLIFLAFALIFIAAVLMPIWLGLTILGGHSRLVVTQDKITLSEGFGPFRKHWKFQTETIQGLVVGIPEKWNNKQLQNISDVDEKTLTAVRVPGMKEPRSAITIVIDADKNPIPFGLGYPHTILVPVAEQIAEHLRSEHRVAMFEDGPTGIPLLAAPIQASSSLSSLEGSLSSSEDEDDFLNEDKDEVESTSGKQIKVDTIPDQPSKSRSLLEVRDNGLTITVPKAGIWKGSKGLMSFAVFWNLFIFGFLAVIVFFSADGGFDVMDIGGLLFAGGILSILLVVGIVTFLYALKIGTQQAVLDVVGNTLIVSRQSCFGLKQFEFEADKITEIAIGFTGTRVNNRPINALFIRSETEPRKLKMLSNLSDDEINWIAAVLRVGMGIER